MKHFFDQIRHNEINLQEHLFVALDYDRTFVFTVTGNIAALTVTTSPSGEVEINQQVFLRCSYSSVIEVLVVSWYKVPLEGTGQELMWKYKPGRKNEVAAAFSGKFMFDDDSDLSKEHRIRIDRVRSEDQANYRCFIDTRDLSREQAQASLHVLGEYKNAYSA